MSCPACNNAAQKPRTAERTNGCYSCQARMLAAIGAHEESVATKKMTQQFKEALQKLFADRWQDAGAEVKRWGQKIEVADRQLSQLKGIQP